MKRHLITSNNVRDNIGNSLIGLAAQVGDFDMLRLLLARGLDPNTQDNEGNTPLHYAINGGYFHIADMLITNGADESKQNILGLEPWAVQ